MSAQAVLIATRGERAIRGETAVPAGAYDVEAADRIDEELTEIYLELRGM